MHVESLLYVSGHIPAVLLLVSYLLSYQTLRQGSNVDEALQALIAAAMGLSSGGRLLLF